MAEELLARAGGAEEGPLVLAGMHGGARWRELDESAQRFEFGGHAGEALRTALAGLRFDPRDGRVASLRDQAREIRNLAAGNALEAGT